MSHNLENMSASEIGRHYAPAEIKDCAGWGRKLVRRAKNAGQSIADALGLSPAEPEGMTQAELTRYAMLMRDDPHRYKAPHANRPTPRRIPSRVRQPRFFIDGAQETRVKIPA